MLFSDRIKLRAVTTTEDASGYDATTTNIDTDVWANKKSVTRSEFYASNKSGINMVQAFDVHVEDWNNQTFVVDGTQVYKIERSYQKGLGIVELNCSEVTR